MKGRRARRDTRQKSRRNSPSAMHIPEVLFINDSESENCSKITKFPPPDYGREYRSGEYISAGGHISLVSLSSWAKVQDKSICHTMFFDKDISLLRFFAPYHYAGAGMYCPNLVFSQIVLTINEGSSCPAHKIAGHRIFVLDIDISGDCIEFFPQLLSAPEDGGNRLHIF